MCFLAEAVGFHGKPTGHRAPSGAAYKKTIFLAQGFFYLTFLSRKGRPTPHLTLSLATINSWIVAAKAEGQRPTHLEGWCREELPCQLA
jgi:hypothetical protein